MQHKQNNIENIQNRARTYGNFVLVQNKKLSAGELLQKIEGKEKNLIGQLYHITQRYRNLG